MSNIENDIINEFEKEKLEGAYEKMVDGEIEQIQLGAEIPQPIVPEPVLTPWFDKNIQPIIDNLK